MDIDILKKRLKAGQPTKYDEERHLTLLAQIMNEGEDIEAFCDEAMISRPTFYTWLKTHPNFREAYDILINVAERKWKSYPLKAENFSFPYWNTIMRNRFGYGKSKIKPSKGDDPLEKIKAAWESLQESTLTVQDYTHVMNSIMTEIKAITLQKMNAKYDKQGKTDMAYMNREELLAIIHS